MAQKVLVEIVDDLDGGVATQTVPFALDGLSYEIDLSDENAQTLREQLARYIDAGRRVGGRRIRTAVGQSTTSGGSHNGPATASNRERNQRVRARAQANGYKISDRGRISNEVYAAFEAGESAVPVVELEPAAETPAKPARKRAPRKKTVGK
ncbi:histone-like nucleoid-structuring protein Lsr2 [Amycolatopsis dendrobii]|uniref:Lsr2 family protein n=1 Tax=Amycolatopsis dendrobii TaxID=2760662 RepID=A0A7W3VSU7_9PSEU|nr:Lsr2 family protein [Amycolatopsis dendrobii]MBB1152500.1 Lsr2 family protein [Amycolatopsis dendrobii]